MPNQEVMEIFRPGGEGPWLGAANSTFLLVPTPTCLGPWGCWGFFPCTLDLRGLDADWVQAPGVFWVQIGDTVGVCTEAWGCPPTLHPPPSMRVHSNEPFPFACAVRT